MYFQCLILLTISQIISGAVIKGKRAATFSGTELKQICKSIRDDLNDGINPDKAVGQIVQQFETKLASEDGSRLTKFRSLLKTFKDVVEIVEYGKLKDLSTSKQDYQSNESYESSQSADNVNKNQPDLGDNEPIKENDPIDNPNDSINPDDSDNEIDSGSFNDNEVDTELDSNDTDEYDVCELINYPDWIDLDEIDYSEIYGYDYDDYDDAPYEYEYQFEPFGLRLNLHLSISD